MKYLKKILFFVISVLAMVILSSLTVSAAEYALFPGNVLNITQGVNGGYSHGNTNAIDLVGNSDYFAPFSGTITYIWTECNGVVLQSDSEVYYADGNYGYMSVMFMHDNDISDLWVGKHINQGEIFYQPGVKGWATGTHLHLCVRSGQDKFLNDYDNGNVLPYDALYLKDTTNVVNGYGYNWRTCNPNPLGNPVDLGTDFYAVIINVPAWKHLHYEENGNVVLRSAQDNTRQIWKFERQSDLSYKIISTYDGKLLDVDGAGTSNGTNVQTFIDHENAAQQWFFYGESGHYYIRAKHSNLVLDLAGNNSNEGSNIDMWEYNGSDAQIYQVYRTDMNVPTLNVSVSSENEKTQLSWSSALGVNVYNVRIKQGEQDYSVWNVTATNCDVQLPAGTYTAYIDACNYTSIRKSNEITFTVLEDISKPKIYNNMTLSDTAYNINTDIKYLTQSAVYAAAVYTADGKLIDVKTENLSSGATSASVSIAKNDNASYIKVYLWDSLNSMKPLTECERIDL